MNKSDNHNDINLNHHEDDHYGDHIPPPNDNTIPLDEINAVHHGHTNGHEAFEDTRMDMTENGHVDNSLEDENGEVGWNFLTRPESIDGEEGADIEPFGLPALPRGVHIPGYGWFDFGRPHHPDDCPCPCHHTPAQAETPGDWMPEPATPSPEGQGTPSSMQVELSTGENSTVSSGYFSPNFSTGELVRLMMPYVTNLFVTRPLVLNGPIGMPLPPGPYRYSMELALSEDENDEEDYDDEDYDVDDIDDE